MKKHTIAILILLGWVARAQAAECIAHRGFSAVCPENSMMAISNAWKAGAGIVEVDVRQLNDGTLVLFHDAEINGTRVRSLSFPQLVRMTTLPVTTLDKALRILPEDRQYLLDLKDDSARCLSDITAAITKSGVPVDRLIFQSGSLRALDGIRKRFPNARLFLVTSLDYQGPAKVPPSSSRLARHLKQKRLHGITGQGRQFIDEKFIRDFQDQGLQFFVWTINPKDRMQHYLDLGVDGIITDRPDALAELMQGSGE